MSALNRACSLKAKEILAQRAPRQGVCGRHGEKEESLTWGDLVVFPVMVFMPQGRRAGGISEAIRQRPKGLSDARREVRVLVVVRKRRESGVTCTIGVQGRRSAERDFSWCEARPQGGSEEEQEPMSRIRRRGKFRKGKTLVLGSEEHR
jgi:hypothetical protein